MRADDAAELRFDRLPEAIRAIGMLPAQVQADRLEVLWIDGVHHHGAIPLLSFDRAGAECQIVGMRRDQWIGFAERQRVVAEKRCQGRFLFIPASQPPAGTARLVGVEVASGSQEGGGLACCQVLPPSVLTKNSSTTYFFKCRTIPDSTITEPSRV